MRTRIIALIFLFAASANSAHCGVLEQMTADGSISKVAVPNFANPKQAQAFGAKCRALATELGQSYTADPGQSELLRNALMAGEFLYGRPYTLKTTQVPSVIKLREWVKAPAPDGVAYVRIYPSREAMPSFVQSAFEKPETRGVTMGGRYIAIIKSPYPKEMQDVLSHEMVHAYLTQASPKPLPTWFQEGVAVYLSTGKDSKFYGREAGVPEGVVQTLPEDYKNNLFIFSYLEQSVGKDKVYKLIRETLRTGDANMRVVGFGFAEKRKQAEQQMPSKRLIAAGVIVLAVAIIGIGAWISKRREEDF